MTSSGIPCPTNPDHGHLLILDRADRPLYCPHSDHTKTVTTDKPIQFLFTYEEAERTMITRFAAQAKAARAATRKTRKSGKTK